MSTRKCLYVRTHMFVELKTNLEERSLSMPRRSQHKGHGPRGNLACNVLQDSELACLGGRELGAECVAEMVNLTERERERGSSFMIVLVMNEVSLLISSEKQKAK